MATNHNLNFICYKCQASLSTANILLNKNKNEARGRCAKCNIWTTFPLPEIKKKLIYLDQSFFSDIYSETVKEDLNQRLKEKLLLLRQKQKIFLVVSDIHSYETSNIPEQHSKQKTEQWKFQNSMADGCIAGNFDNVVIAQTRRMLLEKNSFETFPHTDIGLKNPHQFMVGMNIISTNTWRDGLNQSSKTSSEQQNEAISDNLDRQVEKLPDNCKLSDCLHHIQELRKGGLQQGIKDFIKDKNFTLQSEEIISEINAGRTPSFQYPQISRSSFYPVIKSVVEGLDEDAALMKWSDLLKNDNLGLCPSLRIRIAMEAELLWIKKQGHRQNPKKFSENFGVSRHHDIQHIASFFPYVDAITTDNEMFNFCQREAVKKELNKYPTKIYAKKYYNDFEAWLSDLIKNS
ncbi:hypothetical protein MGMO_8c01030 [Methyloglobulus morosus KoM1]|uniref:Uncharacterized protein n=1 Tax=Methyloglobulus morosus KoM1 TaxID=1116472 RepID=V5E328_9GAMM|nr:hypothetical protein [Methyloglobulus morosus]ESS73966.1 hypothetical protein MGMO_8c01030 [Methyloglobulus morosus KoM1]